MRIAYIHPAPFVRNANYISTLYVHVTTVAQETRLVAGTERLNSGNQRNRNLKR